MLVKLYDGGLKGKKWLFLNNWYEKLTTQIKWNDEASSVFIQTVGVRQGGIWSPTAYKFFVNPLLDKLKNHSLYLHIGTIYCGVAGVANDLLFMSRESLESQVQLSVQEDFASNERYTLSDT